MDITTWGTYDENLHSFSNLRGCKMHAPGLNIRLTDSHSSPIDLGDTIIFANGLKNSSDGDFSAYEITGGGYLIPCTPFTIGGSSSSGGSSSGSGDYVTRTEMEEYVNETIIGGEW